MKYTVCSIFDRASREYSQPFYTPNQATAQREFLRLQKDPQSAVHAFPEDYKLFVVAEFDTESGTMFELTQIQDITP
ncbi:MAG: nonstructural protein [Microvirus sp.]|nr:MAG: nonstructural protein [Microvirus sp.]